MCFLKISVALLGLTVVSACDVYSDVSTTGNNEFLLTEVDMKIGVGGVRPSVVSSVHAKSKDFCSKRNSSPTKISDQFETARLGSLASYSLRFKCT